MNGNREKTERTRAALKRSLSDMCERKPYLDITISDICAGAGVDRSTFYRYFSAKDEALREIEDDYIKELNELTPKVHGLLADGERGIEAWREELVSSFNYHKKHRAVAAFLFSESGDPYFRRHIVISLKTNFENILKKHIPLNERAEYMTEFFVRGYLGVLERWTARQDVSASDMAGFVINVVRFLSNADQKPFDLRENGKINSSSGQNAQKTL